jgi:endonuclease/exonuclease/phosphatase family metal-dependent hydrolase
MLVRSLHRTALLVVVAVALVAAGCSSGDDGATADDADRAGTTPTTEGSASGGARGNPDITVVTFNLLHGLFLGSDCPEETDGCQADARLDMTWDQVEAAGCPDIIGLQEVGPSQQERIPATLPDVCGGIYEVVSADPALPVEQWILSSLPVLDAASEPISGISRSIQWVQLESAIGPIDFVTTHFVASVDNLPCTDELCGELCEIGVEAGLCNPVEALDFVERQADPATPTILTGDLNATIDETRITTLIDAGFVDVWTLAGNDECEPDDGTNCTSGLSGDGPYAGLDQPANTRTSRIDYVLVRAPDDCELRVDGPDDGDGDDTTTGMFAGEPVAPPVEGVYWPSDHTGVQADLWCS